VLTVFRTGQRAQPAFLEALGQHMIRPLSVTQFSILQQIVGHFAIFDT
jgi:hypothetical protein